MLSVRGRTSIAVCSTPESILLHCHPCYSRPVWEAYWKMRALLWQWVYSVDIECSVKNAIEIWKVDLKVDLLGESTGIFVICKQFVLQPSSSLNWWCIVFSLPSWYCFPLCTGLRCLCSKPHCKGWIDGDRECPNRNWQGTLCNFHLSTLKTEEECSAWLYCDTNR